ncbi:MAG TPA: hypothetical protein V6D22_06355 [Candidatus Obscuribacterales bacterium]
MLERSFETDFDLAELLVITGFVKPHDLDRAYAACRDDMTPLRNILLQNRMVEPEILVAAVQVINEIKEGHLPPSLARSVLFLMGNCQIPVQEAMAKLGIVGMRNPWHTRLTEMQQQTV